jgi:hypothetical protein
MNLASPADYGAGRSRSAAAPAAPGTPRLGGLHRARRRPGSGTVAGPASQVLPESLFSRLVRLPWVVRVWGVVSAEDAQLSSEHFLLLLLGPLVLALPCEHPGDLVPGGQRVRVVGAEDA